MWSILGLVGRVDGFLDLKCDDGSRVKTVKSTGIRPALSIGRSIPEKDASSIPNAVIIKDITHRFDLANCFELVTAIGILEDFPEEKREVLVGNVARHSEKWLVIDGEQWFLEALERQGFHLHSALDQINGNTPMLLLRRNESS